MHELKAVTGYDFASQSFETDRSLPGLRSSLMLFLSHELSPIAVILYSC